MCERERVKRVQGGGRLGREAGEERERGRERISESLIDFNHALGLGRGYSRTQRHKFGARQLGYRAMWQLLRRKYHLVARRYCYEYGMIIRM